MPYKFHGKGVTELHMKKAQIRVDIPVIISALADIEVPDDFEFGTDIPVGAPPYLWIGTRLLITRVDSMLIQYNPVTRHENGHAQDIIPIQGNSMNQTDDMIAWLNDRLGLSKEKSDG